MPSSFTRNVSRSIVSDISACRLWMHRNCQFDAGLSLPDMQHAVADVLAAEMYDIGATLAAIEQQSKCQSCARAYRMPRLELRNLVFTPPMVAICFNPYRPHVPRRVIRTHAEFRRMLHQRAEHLAQHVGSCLVFVPPRT